MAGKISVLTLRDGLGNAICNVTTKKLDFPAGVPKSRFSLKGLKKGRKVLMAGLHGVPATTFCAFHDFPHGPSLSVNDTEVVSDALSLVSIASTNQSSGMDGFSFSPSASIRSEFLGANEMFTSEDDVSVSVPRQSLLGNSGSRCLLSVGVSQIVLYVDSGTGQSLCSSSTAFSNMTPCQMEITSIAGALQIYGCGTALFLSDDGSGQPFLLRVHNYFYGHGHFNLLSVSQIVQKDGNAVDFTVGTPALILRSSNAKRRQLRLPVFV
jgi:hypothetical protein